MDFGRPLTAQASIASRSQIRYLPVPPPSTNDDEDARLDRSVIVTANQVARELLVGQGPYDNATKVNNHGSAGGENNDDKKEADQATDDDSNNSLLVPPHCLDASHFKEYMTQPQTTIHAGDLVVIFEAFDKLDFVYCQPSKMFYNRNGHFRHDDFIGKPFGSMVRSHNHSGYGFVYLLKPTPELWARSLLHRTQIVQELDQVQVVMRLNVRPNMEVLESGTGSGAMSHAMLRTIAPKGHLHTFEFNQHRAETARQEFKVHGLGHLVTVQHQDVCVEGFGVPAQSMDACFLDLPEPWLAIPHAVYALKAGAKIATYSPCVEQTQRACAALKASGCHSLQTFEYRLMEHYVDDAEYEALPTESRSIHKPVDAEEAAVETKTNGNAKEEVSKAEVVSSSSDAAIYNNDGATVAPPEKKKQRLVARPFNTMKGHTAFLTYATVGNRPQPNPLDAKQA